MKSCNKGHVTFGDHAKGTIVGKRQLNVTCLHALDNVLPVKELTANLISISQLCDESLNVKLSNYLGTISLDYCHIWNAPSSVPYTSCLVSKEDVIDYNT